LTALHSVQHTDFPFRFFLTSVSLSLFPADYRYIITIFTVLAGVCFYLQIFQLSLNQSVPKVSPSADNFGRGVTGELVRPCQGSTVPETQTNTDATPTFIGMSSGSTEDNKHILVSLRNSFLSLV
jgi:hypothetical protein